MSAPESVEFALGWQQQEAGAGTPSSEDTRRPEPGKFEFLIQGQLGRGGMGIVYQACDPNIGRNVVVKFLRPERQGQPWAVERFLTEARITGQLEHPAIMPVYHLGVDAGGNPFYAMRHIQGESLATILERLDQQDSETLAKYPLGALLNIFQKICDATAYAHSRHVVHRDLKPDNVMIGCFGEVVVTDWGLAKRLSDGIELAAQTSDAAVREAPIEGPKPEWPQTLDNTVMGTPGFMAPEQASGHSHRADERTDVYALGAILYALLTLHAPICEPDARRALDRTRAGDIPPPTDYNPGGSKAVRAPRLAHCPNLRLPGALSAVAMKALATRPTLRYQTVRELQDDVAAYQAGFVTAAEKAGLNRLLGLWVKRHKTIVSALAAVVVIAAGFTWKINRTLNELRHTAPAFYDLAQSLAAAQKLEEALKNTVQALALAPQNADYLLFKGHLLQAMLRLSEARDAYTQAVKLDPSLVVARENIALCQKLLAAHQGQTEWSMDDLVELYDALLQQDRPSEAYAVSRQLDAAKNRFLQFLQQRLSRVGITNQLGWSVHRPAGLGGYPTAGLPKAFKPGSRNYLYLNLDNSDIADLSPLRGLPLQELSLVACRNVVDLKPLLGMPLVRFRCSFGQVGDLSPLTASPLEVLEFSFNNVRDLGPLKLIRTLRSLDFGNVDVSDLSPLEDLPLEVLGVTSAQVTSLEPLRHMHQLTSLGLGHVRITNLRPLAGLHLRELQLNHLDVSDISALRGMPLRILYFSDCPFITDLSPLKNCTTLERLVPPPNAPDIEFLKHFPNLKEISYFKEGPFLSAAEFWRLYDDHKIMRK